MLNMTKHAEIRSQQRGFPKDEIDLILEFGKKKNRPGGAVEFGINKKDKNKIIQKLKRLINKLDKIQKKRVLMIEDSIITVYHKH